MNYISQISQSRFFFFLSLILLVILGILSSHENPVSSVYGLNLNISDPDHVVENAKISQFRVGTYNIHRGRNAEGEDSLVDIIKTIHKSQAQIIGLYEVDERLFGLENDAIEIARQLEMGWIFAPTRVKDFQANYGNALLSKFMLKEFMIKPLVYEIHNGQEIIESNTHRNMAISKFKVNDKDITLISTHLDRGPLKAMQLKEVIDIFMMHSPAILIGDLNTDISDNVLQKGLESGAYQDALQSLKSHHENRIDWILTRGIEINSAGFSPVGPSDHPYFWAELSL